jgi:hypothetical protein
MSPERSNHARDVGITAARLVVELVDLVAAPG